MKNLTRRRLLEAAGLVAVGGIVSRVPAAQAEALKLSGLRIFDVKSYGALADGQTLDSAAINRAIDACHAVGGGLVYVPPGTYLCGTVVLKSNVTLYLEAGATLLGSKKISDYTPQPFSSSGEGGQQTFGADMRDTNPRHLLFARDAENVTVAGPGRLDGQGPSFWAPSNRKPPAPESAWQDVATFDWKPLERPSPMLEFYNCKNLRLEDVRLENAPGWTLRPIECENLFIHGVTIKNPVFGPNTDGIDLTGCKNVFISDCSIDTGDDAICLKSENPYGGAVRPSKNITITNCVLSCCCNGLKFGTATYGSFENITFSNSVIVSEEVNLNARVISGIALEMVDGGSLEGVVISNIRMQRVRTPLFIRRGIRHARADGQPGTLRGVMIDNLSATGSILTSSISGLAGFDVEDVTVSNVRIDSDEAGKAEWAERKIPDPTKAYPEARMFGRLPAYGLYCRHVKGLRLRQLEFRAAEGEARSALFCEDVKDMEVTGLRPAPVAGNMSALKLVQAKKVFVTGCVAPEGTKTFLEVQGEQTERVVVLNNDFSGTEKAVKTGAGVPEKAVSVAGNVGG